jgi:DNA primase
VIPQGFIDDLLTRTDIAEVVGRHVDLKKAGINLKGLCPFHGEKTPSFVVSPSRQTYHCFGCGVHGDAIRFLVEQVGLSFPEAVRELAQQVGLQVPEDRTDPAERARDTAARERQASLSELLGQAAAHYRAQLKAGPRAIDYLKGRGLTGQVAARFGLGYAPPGWRSLASCFARYDDPRLEEAGLVIVQGEEGPDQKRYDRFRDRIMFPIRSVKGEVIGFGGRVLDGGEPKYLNSPETPVFSKGRELYGLYEARRALRDKGYALVVEGYMDVVALAQAGLPNAVATLGTACTAEHVLKLFRHTDAVVFAFDGDAAGRRAAGRALEAALPHATDLRSVRFLFLPPEHDPDSFVRERGLAAFEQAVAAAVPLSRQLIEHAAEGLDLGSAEGRAKMLALARPLWSQLPDGMLRSQVLAGLAEAAGMGADALAAGWGGAPRDRAGGRPRSWATPGRRRAPAAVNNLDRTAWLLARHGELWFTLSEPDQALLAGLPLPHGPFFCALERILHDHGTLTLDGLAAEVAALSDAESIGPLLERVRQLHHFEADASAEPELRALIARLRQQAIDEELQMLMDSGTLSDDAMRRGKELLALRAELRRATAAAAAADEPRAL